MNRYMDVPFGATEIPEQATSRHDDSYDAIAEAAASYATTLQAGDLSVRLGASEDVLHARLALVECLMNVGWRPNAAILTSIHRDEELLLQSNGVLERVVG
jgi:hypothetical protein